VYIIRVKAATLHQWMHLNPEQRRLYNFDGVFYRDRFRNRCQVKLRTTAMIDKKKYSTHRKPVIRVHRLSAQRTQRTTSATQAAEQTPVYPRAHRAALRLPRVNWNRPNYSTFLVSFLCLVCLVLLLHVETIALGTHNLRQQQQRQAPLGATGAERSDQLLPSEGGLNENAAGCDNRYSYW